MKHYAGFLLLTVFICAAAFVNAEGNREQPETVTHYAITAENSNAAGEIVNELEARFDVYNRLFRFDPAALKAPLKVRVFDNKLNYDAYITGHLGETKAGAVYLHYNSTDRRELVIDRSSPEVDSMLAHQSFIQFLRAFVANPPSWITEGFSIFFSTLRYVPSGTPAYEENLLWLETVKSLGDKLPSPEALFTADIQGYPDNFKVSSWALVSFLLNGGRDTFRILSDSFLLLSPNATAAENSETLVRRLSFWNDPETIKTDFKNYLDSRKTFKELMEDGRRAYSRGDPMNAELSFMTAMDQKPSDFAPYYYLGLLYYEEKNYEVAEQYYLSSLERGADEALVNYALGINAASAGRNNDAIVFLKKASASDPAKYQKRVEELLLKLGQ
jgi:tetratricopeptide (TPR) repeat protein